MIRACEFAIDRLNYQTADRSHAPQHSLLLRSLGTLRPITTSPATISFEVTPILALARSHGATSNYRPNGKWRNRGHLATSAMDAMLQKVEDPVLGSERRNAADARRRLRLFAWFVFAISAPT